MHAYEYAEQELSQIAAQKAAAAEAAFAFRELRRVTLDEAIRSFLRQHPAGDELIDCAEFYDEGSERHARIEAPGLSAITVTVHAVTNETIEPVVISRIAISGSYAVGPNLGDLTLFLAAARADWLDRQQKEEQQRARQAQRAAEAAALEAETARQRAADEAKIDAWAPVYRAYLSALRETYRRNCAIFGEIQHQLNAGVFTARQIQYGFRIGEDIGTRTAWIAQDGGIGADGLRAIEIDADGMETAQIFPHPGKIGAAKTYTVHDAPRHLLRRASIFDGITHHDLIAAPSSRPLEAEVKAMLTGRKQIEARPTPPAAPKLADEWRLSDAAAAIEQEVIPDAAEREDISHLFASRLPF